MQNRVINIAMKWRGSLPMLLLVRQDGTTEGREMAEKELDRMATIADMAPIALDALRGAERFIAGFEDDETQEGVVLLLANIREAIASMEG